jgi:TPR repeat protein
MTLPTRIRRWTWLAFIALFAIGVCSLFLMRSVQSQPADLQRAITQYKDGRFSEALPTLLQYANDGNTIAMRVLREMYAFGLGVQYDPERAIHFSRALEETSSEPGAFELHVAQQYRRGERVPKSIERSLEWAALAAEAGNSTARRVPQPKQQ